MNSKKKLNKYVNNYDETMNYVIIFSVWQKMIAWYLFLTVCIIEINIVCKWLLVCEEPIWVLPNLDKVGRLMPCLMIYNAVCFILLFLSFINLFIFFIPPMFLAPLLLLVILRHRNRFYSDTTIPSPCSAFVKMVEMPPCHSFVVVILSPLFFH